LEHEVESKQEQETDEDEKVWECEVLGEESESVLVENEPVEVSSEENTEAEEVFLQKPLFSSRNK
jgi:hypothetical protein